MASEYLKKYNKKVRQTTGGKATNPMQTYGTKEEQLAQQRGEMPVTKQPKAPTPEPMVSETYKKELLASGRTDELNKINMDINRKNYVEAELAKGRTVDEISQDPVFLTETPSASTVAGTQPTTEATATEGFDFGAEQTAYEAANTPEAIAARTQLKAEITTGKKLTVDEAENFAKNRNGLAMVMDIFNLGKWGFSTKKLGSMSSTSSQAETQFNQMDDKIADMITNANTPMALDDVDYQLQEMTELVDQLDRVAKGSDYNDLQYWKDYGATIHELSFKYRTKLEGYKVTVQAKKNAIAQTELHANAGF